MNDLVKTTTPSIILKLNYSICTFEALEPSTIVLHQIEPASSSSFLPGSERWLPMIWVSAPTVVCGIFAPTSSPPYQSFSSFCALMSRLLETNAIRAPLVLDESSEMVTRDRRTDWLAGWTKHLLEVSCVVFLGNFHFCPETVIDQCLTVCEFL